MTQKGLSSAVLAQRAELTPSLLSRLTTENLSTRRDPQIEYILALARVLEVAPAELVAGTEAEPILGQWIPRYEFEKEVQARNEAQAEASELRTELCRHAQRA
ncbi:MAG: helix-turn-helix transcriptional regulator [Chitinophagaceae bacterium]|nr:helix-turn-helix transcriptional regulator [Chitinophagaceae bacterium]